MFWLLIVLFVPAESSSFGPAAICVPACDDTQISAIYDAPLPKKQNQYELVVPVPAGAKEMILKFDSVVTLEMKKPLNNVGVSKLTDPINSYRVRFLEDTKDASEFKVQVLGPDTPITVPYVLSVLLDNEEFCKKPNIGFIDRFID